MQLRRLRQQAGLTQVQLSERSGVPQVRISALECGKTKNPGWLTVRPLADALGVPVSALFEDTDANAHSSAPTAA